MKKRIKIKLFKEGNLKASAIFNYDAGITDKTTAKHEHEANGLTQEKIQEQKFVSIRFYLRGFHLIQFIKQYCLFALAFKRYICIKTHRRLKRIVVSQTNYLPGVTAR